MPHKQKTLAVHTTLLVFNFNHKTRDLVRMRRVLNNGASSSLACLSGRAINGLGRGVGDQFPMLDGTRLSLPRETEGRKEDDHHHDTANY